MTKYYRYLIAVGVFFVTTLVIFIVLDMKLDKKEQAELDAIAPVNLATFDANSIDELRNEYPDASSMHFLYDLKNDCWTLPAEPNFKFESTSIAQTLTYFSALVSLRKIEANPIDLGKYGLDKPITVTAVLEDDSTYQVLIGNETAIGDSYYACLATGETVYTIAADYAESIALTRNDLREKFILNSSYPFATHFAVERDGKTVFSVSKKDSVWSASAPFDGTLDLANITTYITALLNVKYFEFIEENPADISKYGLDKPKYALELSTEEKDVRVIFGNAYADNTYIYAQFNDSPDVVAFALADIPVIYDDASFIYTSTIYMTGLTNISRAEIVLDGKTVTLDSNIYDDIKEYAVNGKDITDNEELCELYEEFFTGVVGIYFENIDMDAAVDMTAEPVVSAKYTALDGTETKVEYFRCPDDSTYGSNFYYAVVDGKYTNLVVRDNTFNVSRGIRRTYAALMTAIEKFGV